MKRTLMMSAALAAAFLLSGCAGDQLKKDVAELRAMTEKAQASADRAQTSADAAKAEAGKAAAKADAAEDTADMALDEARESQACCSANSEKVDRMFRKAMMK